MLGLYLSLSPFQGWVSFSHYSLFIDINIYSDAEKTALHEGKLFTFMHLADVFIQNDLHRFKKNILLAHVFPGNQTHDHGVASLSYRNVM